jgi:hypothetical protein
VSEVEKRKEEENERIGKHVDMTVHTIKSVSSINNSVEEILNLGSDAFLFSTSDTKPSPILSI